MPGASARASFAIVALLSAVPAAETQPAADLVSKLLALPAPPKDWKAFVRDLNRTLPPERHWGIDGPPGDEAPIGALLGYWLDPWLSWDSPRVEPNDRVRDRLLEACEQGHARRLPAVLPWLKKTPEVFDRVRKIYDERLPGEERVHDWLMENSTHFRDVLVRRARERDEPERQASALAFLHAHAARAGDRAEEEALLKRLVSLVGGRSLSLEGPVLRDPDTWMPILRRLAGDEEQAIRERAAEYLSRARESIAGIERERRLLEKAWQKSRRHADPRSVCVRPLLGEWPSDVSDEDLLRVLAGCEAEVQSVLHALDRREVLRAESEGDLRGLVEKGGAIAGVAAVVLGDRAIVDGILGGSDSDALGVPHRSTYLASTPPSSRPSLLDLDENGPPRA
ncbi:MAG: hypothetical protein JXP34_08925, partial [Planctomycetes bacterium]|nr:hypothetical protein [Planctomycetota bacterium]